MIMTLRLYGKMGKLFGRTHKPDLSTGSVGEAVAYLRANFKGVDRYLRSATKNGVGFAVFRGKENLDKDQLREPCFGDDIRIAPVLLGSKNGGIVSIILGGVLIVAGVVLSAYFPGNPVSPYLIGSGISLVAGGVIQMLTPRPQGLSAKDRPEDTPSYAFNGPINTQAQGHRVPVLYGGPMWVGSAVISAGMDIKDDVVAPLSGSQAPGGGGAAGGGTGDGLMGRFRTLLA